MGRLHPVTGPVHPLEVPGQGFGDGVRRLCSVQKPMFVLPGALISVVLFSSMMCYRGL